MKKLFPIVLLLTLISCGKKSDDKSANNSDFCQPTKYLFDTWQSRDSNIIYNMNACQYGQTCEVKFGDGVCDDSRGDFSFIVDSTINSVNGRKYGYFVIKNCAGDTVLDTGRYDLSCENILSLTYDSDNSVEDFD